MGAILSSRALGGEITLHLHDPGKLAQVHGPCLRQWQGARGYQRSDPDTREAI